MTDPTPAKVELGFSGTVSLIAVPRTRIVSLDPPSVGKVGELETIVPVTGTWEGFTEKEIPAQLSWIVRYERTRETAQFERDSAEFTVSGKMTAKSGDKFEFLVDGSKPVLRAVEQQLFGKGTVGFRLVPEFPHSAEATCKPSSKISFENPLHLKINGADGSSLAPLTLSGGMGFAVSLKLVAGALVEKMLDGGATVYLSIDQSDAGSRKKVQDLYTASWDKASQHDAVPWLVGCTVGSAVGAPVFQYPREAASYEFTYRLGVVRPPPFKADLVPAIASQPLFNIDRPALTSFALSYEPVPLPRLVAKGAIRGIAGGLMAPAVVSFWRQANAPGRYQRFDEKKVVLEGGVFEADHDLPLDSEAARSDPFAQWLKSFREPSNRNAPGAILATVRFADASLLPKRAPIGSLLTFDAKRFSAFDEAHGVVSSRPSLANALTSDRTVVVIEMVHQMRMDVTGS